MSGLKMYTEDQKTLANLMRARFPYLYMQTWEEERVLSFVESVASDVELIKTKRDVLIWKSTTGFVDLNGNVINGTVDSMKMLRFIAEYERPCIAVLLDFHKELDNNKTNVFGDSSSIIRTLRDMVIKIKHSNIAKNIVFSSPCLVIPEELQKDITIFDFKLPSYLEIKSVLDRMIRDNEENPRINIALNEAEKERLAKATLGLTLAEAENAFAYAMVKNSGLQISDIKTILSEKKQIIKKAGNLEFIESDLKMEEVGGLENLKHWVNKRNKSWLDLASKYNLPAPKGILLTGVPGCGKSLVSKSISTMWGLPLLRLDMGSIFGKWLGDSEANMRNAIKTAEAISPCILWIDEIEKGLGVNGEHDTSLRVFGHFLTWMQEKTKPVFVVATANNISGLPPELMRKGRFDEIFFVDIPTKIERKKIIELHINKRLNHPDVIGEFKLTEEVLDHLANKSEGFVGAEIEQVVIDGLFEAFAEDRAICLSDFEKAIDNTVPLSVTQREQILSIRNWATERAVAATLSSDKDGLDNF